MSGKAQPEEERLFKIGYDSGKQFLEAARSGKISDEEIRQKVPIGVSGHAAGPTVDFALGRIYEAASTDAFDRIVKRGFDGLSLTPDKWVTDDEVKKIKSGTLFVFDEFMGVIEHKWGSYGCSNRQRSPNRKANIPVA